MTFVDDLLPDIDSIRCIPDESGLRPYTVTLRVTTWTPAPTDDTDIQLGR
jgi:hypothetical protein